MLLLLHHSRVAEEIYNALLKHWLTKFNTPMQAPDFDQAPVDFDGQESDWYMPTSRRMSRS